MARSPLKRAENGRISSRERTSNAVSKQGSKDDVRVEAVGTLGHLPGIASAAEERNDVELIRAARSGDHAAFESLVRRYSERAYRAAYRVVRDSDMAEEVLQEALIKAYKGLARFEFRSSFYTWLYRIVVNLALDRRRRAARAPQLEWDDAVVDYVLKTSERRPYEIQKLCSSLASYALREGAFRIDTSMLDAFLAAREPQETEA